MKFVKCTNSIELELEASLQKMSENLEKSLGKVRNENFQEVGDVVDWIYRGTVY